MNLVVDVGNTLVKLAVFKDGAMVFKKISMKKDLFKVLDEAAMDAGEVKDCIVSAVGKLGKGQLKKLKELYPVHELSYKSVVPFKNKYETPQTLGVDRIALMSAAAMSYTNKNVLVIDAGSCITYDFLTSSNEYLGGGISPGINMRYNSLHKFTSRLPLLEINMPKELIGNSTASSIHSGVILGAINEINGFVDAYFKKFGDLTVILTGGDAHFLLDSLKNDIFANSNFLLEGLNHILELNKDRC